MTEPLPVSDLARRCQEETDRYRRGQTHNDRFCFELFRLAIAERDELAWAAIHTQYAETVRRWVGTKMDVEEGAALAFERFWQALDDAKFVRFPALAQVLQYLKVCVHSVVLDRARVERRREDNQPLEFAEHVAGGEDVEDSVAHRLDGAALWRQVSAALADEQERLVLYLSYVIGLTPRQIQDRHTDRFPTVGEVYRLKRAALMRLRHHPGLRHFQ